MKHFAKFVMAKPSPSQCSESALAESHRQLRGMHGCCSRHPPTASAPLP
jgi:hypothetical protein